MARFESVVRMVTVVKSGQSRESIESGTSSKRRELRIIESGKDVESSDGVESAESVERAVSIENIVIDASEENCESGEW